DSIARASHDDLIKRSIDRPFSWGGIKSIARRLRPQKAEGPSVTILQKLVQHNSNELRSRVHFSSETGHIWLHEHRMLLVHADAQASLRKELIDTLGLERARGLLTRMGYASGVRDAELARGR